jgi:hypothetical protein
MTPRAVLVAAVGLITLAAAARGQQPNRIVDVQLVGVGTVTVEAVLTDDSTLLLPAAEVTQLLGLPAPTSPWLTVAQLQKMFPPIQVTWQPRALTVLIRDDLLALPASRTTRDALMRTAQGAAPYLVTRSGPFLAWTFDQLGRELYQAGYSWRGWVAVSGQRSRLGTTYTVSVVPSPILFASYTGGSQPQASARVALGPAWLSTTWNRGQALVTDALVQLGRVSAFASSRKTFVVTVRGPIDAQIGRVNGVTTGRVSLGPIPPNPFSPPTVP